MALTKATYSMIEGAPLNALDFGADPTGVADSTSAIQAVITEGIAQERRVFFPAGTYKYASNSPFNIVTQNTASLEIYGDPYGDTTFLLDANNVIFRVSSGETGSGPSYKFIVRNMKFEVVNPLTNSNATIFYICRLTNDWGAHFYFEDCDFTNFTNCGVHGVRCYNSGAYRCNFKGTSTQYSQSSGVVGLNDAGIRLWGADGTLTVQDHSFCNLITIDTCVFREIQLGTDFWNFQGSIKTCTFFGVWAGIVVRQTDNGNTVFGNVSNAEKGGFQMCFASIDNCWFEQIFLYSYAGQDLNLSTGAVIPTSPSARADVVYQNERNYRTAAASPLSNPTLFSQTGEISTDGALTTRNRLNVYSGSTRVVELVNDAGVDSLLLSSTGLTIGKKTTLTNNSAINNVETQVSAADNTWVNLFAPTLGVYILAVRIFNLGSADHSATAMVFNNNIDVAMLNKANGANIDLQVSGSNIQVRQTTGTTQLVDYSFLRVF